jgi:DNA-directed RNA polymerase subunit M/transcription elongation factor TFIIS
MENASHKEFYNNRLILPNVYYKPPYCTTRRARVVLLYCSLRSNASFKALELPVQHEMVMEIESGALDKALDDTASRSIGQNWSNPLFVAIYNSIMYKTQTHVEATTGPWVIDRLLSGDIVPRLLAAMTTEELLPHTVADIRKQISTRLEQKIITKVTTQYECMVCHKSQATSREEQLRALDEGSTVFLTCVTEGCGNEWTIGGS